MRRSPVRRLSGVSFTVLLLAGFASAQQPANRILEQIDSGTTTVLPGSLNPRVTAARDLGRLDSATPIEGITLWFQPTAAQQADLDALVQAQQTPGSPSYHAWLTPAQYAARFGLSDADLAQVENWLESQGFNIDRVSNSRTSITFSGTAAQVESAFQTQLDRYQTGAETHFANSTDLAIPSALTGIVRSVRNLDDFRPSPHFRPSAVQPSFTYAPSGAHFLSPKDIGTIYDINAAWNSGYTGSGVTIAVVGQTQVSPSDITAFQSAAGLTAKAPNLILVPNSGTSAVVSGDEAESDLDLEYAGGIAPGATIDFIYVGNAKNLSVFDALQYAIDNKVGSIINISYGACEPDVSSSSFSALEGILEQGASQGQTVVAASGDDGSTACYYPTNNTVTAPMQVLAVNYPASSAYAVGVGGTEFPAADASSSTYWKSASSSDVVSSALSYIPEQAWNDDSASIGTQYGAQYALSSGGGGISTLTARPSWQTGVPGIPSGSFRLVPDVSLASSPNYVAYVYCSSDTSGWSSGQKASCNSGFRDSITQDLTVAGGTSFASPIFAGMLAILTQKQGSSGLGVANRTLYSLASNSSTYASAFHDITSGSNKCTAGAPFCSSSGASQYAAGVGYDEATGLGSVDFNNLMTAWAGCFQWRRRRRHRQRLLCALGDQCHGHARHLRHVGRERGSAEFIHRNRRLQRRLHRLAPDLRLLHHRQRDGVWRDRHSHAHPLHFAERMQRRFRCAFLCLAWQRRYHDFPQPLALQQDDPSQRRGLRRPALRRLQKVPQSLDPVQLSGSGCDAGLRHRMRQQLRQRRWFQLRRLNRHRRCKRQLHGQHRWNRHHHLQHDREHISDSDGELSPAPLHNRLPASSFRRPAYFARTKLMARRQRAIPPTEK